MTNLGIVRLLKKEHDLLTKQIQGISAALSAFGAVYGEPNGAGRKMEGAGERRTMSASARARIGAAQKARWAKLKGKNGQTKSAAPGAPKKGRTMSASARRKIAAAQRLRWKKFKASQKKAA
jgi:hypothetical protein